VTGHQTEVGLEKIGLAATGAGLRALVRVARLEHKQGAIADQG